MYEDLDYCPSLSVTYRMSEEGGFYAAGYKCEVLANIEGFLNFGSLEELIEAGGVGIER